MQLLQCHPCPSAVVTQTLIHPTLDPQPCQHKRMCIPLNHSAKALEN